MRELWAVGGVFVCLASAVAGANRQAGRQPPRSRLGGCSEQAHLLAAGQDRGLELRRRGALGARGHLCSADSGEGVSEQQGMGPAGSRRLSPPLCKTRHTPLPAGVSAGCCKAAQSTWNPSTARCCAPAPRGPHRGSPRSRTAAAPRLRGRASREQQGGRGRGLGQAGGWGRLTATGCQADTGAAAPAAAAARQAQRQECGATAPVTGSASGDARPSQPSTIESSYEAMTCRPAGGSIHACRGVWADGAFRCRQLALGGSLTSSSSGTTAAAADQQR